MNLQNIYSSVLFTAEELKAKILNLSQQINAYYAYKVSYDKPLVCVGILKGCLPFLADLLNYLTIPVVVDYMSIVSWRGASQASGEITINADIMSIPIEKRHVLIIDDIYDSGASTQEAYQFIQSKKPLSVEFAILLNKQITKTYDITVRFLGFDVPNQFLIGYGLDYQELFRYTSAIGIANLDYINSFINKKK